MVEKRLIDARAYHLRLCNIPMTDVLPEFRKLTKEEQDLICRYAKEHERLLLTAPTVDAVEVVRCRYCKKAHPELAKRFGDVWCVKWGKDMKLEDFCSCGERIW